MEEGFYIFFPFRILQLAGELHDTEKTCSLLTGLKAGEENTNQKHTGVFQYSFGVFFHKITPPDMI